MDLANEIFRVGFNFEAMKIRGKRLKKKKEPLRKVILSIRRRNSIATIF